MVWRSPRAHPKFLSCPPAAPCGARSCRVRGGSIGLEGSSGRLLEPVQVTEWEEKRGIGNAGR
eukprot:scaffold4099_cov403-Prasinococcus_capsulatus_cf.AAC.6